MPSFVLNTLSTTARTLNPGEMGRIDPSGILLSGLTPLSMSGAFLQNFGQIIGTGLTTINVTGPGSTIQNIGTIRNMATNGTAISLSGITAPSASFNLLNTNLIEAVGSGAFALRSAAGGLTITNTGAMVALQGTGIRIGDTGGSIGNTIINNGLIQARLLEGVTAAIRIDNNDADLIQNAGTIIGDVSTGGGNDVIQNTGSISRFTHTGAGDDLVVNSGSMGVIPTGGLFVTDLGDGNDTVDARDADGGMFVKGGLGDDLYIFGAEGFFSTLEYFGHGNDTVQSFGDHQLSNNFETLELLGTAVRGFGSVDSNTLRGNDANNLLDGRQGDDTLFGNGGNDVVIGDAGNDVLNGGDGTDDLRGEADNDVISGDANDDFLFGGTGNDSLFGGAGNDLLFGEEGRDLLDGGSGLRDVASYVISQQGLRADLQLSLTNTGDAAGDTYVSIEDLTGTGFNDTLAGDGADNVLVGRSGEDLLAGRVGNDTLVGAEDNDLLFGNEGNDDLFGDTGNDLLEGGIGADDLFGGDGTDAASYAAATAGLRADLQVATTNTGEAAGDSYISVENLIGSAFNDLLVGDSQNNGIAGGNGADGVFGRDGNDTLAGDAGADTLFGGTGNDVLVGGTEADVFVFDTAASASNIDTILDFSVVDDTIAIENAVFSGLAAGPLAASAFVSGTQATLASHRIVYNGATGQLFFDADGSGAGAAIQIATLVAAPALTAADFLVI